MIWCVEDDADIREIEIYTLKATGFDARGFADGGAFRAALAEEIPDLVIMDIMLPGEDGVSLLGFLKNNPATKGVPVIMATAKGTEYDKVESLDLGADDYLVKPFGMMEMVSRVKAVLRRSGRTKAEEQLLGLRTKDSRGEHELGINQTEHTVSVDGAVIELTLKEYELLRLFVTNPGVVFTRDRLGSEVWGESFLGETRTIDTHIGTLRKKIGPFGKMIITVRGVGYRLER